MKNAFDMLGGIKTKSKISVSAHGAKKVRNTEELDTQGAYIEWAKLQPYRGRKVFDFLIHHPAEGKRGPQAQREAKKLGMKSGVLDIQIIVPTDNHPGMWIEFKAKDGRWKESQEEFRDICLEMGYRVEEARTVDAAIAMTKEYLGIK